MLGNGESGKTSNSTESSPPNEHAYIFEEIMESVSCLIPSVVPLHVTASSERAPVPAGGCVLPLHVPGQAARCICVFSTYKAHPG